MAVFEVGIHRCSIYLRRSGYEGAMAGMVLNYDYGSFLSACIIEWHVDVQDTRKFSTAIRKPKTN